ncbi:MAG TPA: minor capsid protein [Firmicutes bacterium]|nr:minor capsid protein [Bacillota bacterium]
MNNEEYWLKRRIADLARVYNFTEERIRMLKRDYNLAIKDIKKLLRDGNIEDYEKKRLKELQKHIEERLQTLFELEEAYIASALVHVFEEEYYHGIYNLNQLVGYATGTYYIAPDTVEAAITTAWSGASYSSRIWKRKKELGKNVEDILRKGIMMGYSNAKMAKQLSERMDASFRQAARLVRTETSYVANKATMEAYKELEVEEYEFLATLDLRTSETCRHMDGKTFPREKAQVGLNYPPLHPNCRSTTIPVVDDLGFEESRIAKDADGKYYEVPASMKYEQWYEKYVKTNPRFLAEEKKIKNRYADEKQFVKYQEALGNHAPRTLEEFQEMKYNDVEKWNVLASHYRYKNMLDRRKIVDAKEKRSLPIVGEANSIADLVDNGIVKQRRQYDYIGKAKQDIDTSDHGQPKNHPTGAHKHEFDYNLPVPRKGWDYFSEDELKMNEDIIRKGDNYHDDRD